MGSNPSYMAVADLIAAIRIGIETGLAHRMRRYKAGAELGPPRQQLKPSCENFHLPAK